MRHLPKSDEVVPSTYDQDGPIDFEQLKSVIISNGPFILTFIEWSVSFVINITPCQVEGCDCKEDVISITQSSGFTSLSTLIRREELEQFESLADLARTFLHHPEILFNPSAEQQYLEGEVRKHLGIDPTQIYHSGPLSGGLKATLSDECKEDFWRAHNLQSIFWLLVEHRRMVQSASALDDKTAMRDIFETRGGIIDLLHDHYTLGFLTGRLISEHFVRYEIEPLAELGLSYEEAQERRNMASGKSSSNKRSQRINAMLMHMEMLAADNPALCRAGMQVLADLAIQDAMKVDERLWAQGKGQRDEYLDEMRSDLRYQSRFKVLLEKVM